MKSFLIGLVGFQVLAAQPLLVYANAATELVSEHQKKVQALQFDANAYTLKTLISNGKAFKYRAYENIVYVQKPVDAKYQSMHIYIPEAYFEGKSIEGFTAKTAPIFLPNNIGGYMPSAPQILGGEPPHGATDRKPPNGLPPSLGQNAASAALTKGYVVAIPGARGRTLQDTQQHNTGKAPAAIVDLKAAVRYLRFNDKTMPGDAEKIISNGTSAGGAMSALLGASGNSPDYFPYLKSLGAANVRDDIFAVSAYCPITLLEHADAAYEWQFSGEHQYKKMVFGQMIDYHMERKEVSGTLTANEIQVSKALKAGFPAYVNSLKLKDMDGEMLSMDENGEGRFKEVIKQQLIVSAQRALDAGQNLKALSWLTIKDGKVTDLNFEAYVKATGRMKTPPAFDALDLSSGENDLFGTAQTKARHFTPFGLANSTVKGTLAEANVVRMMNPISYIGESQAKTATYWRIRHGTTDKDTSLAISTILALRLQNAVKKVDFAYPWGVPHGGDYDLDELFKWMAQVTK